MSVRRHLCRVIEKRGVSCGVLRTMTCDRFNITGIRYYGRIVPKRFSQVHHCLLSTRRTAVAGACNYLNSDCTGTFITTPNAHLNLVILRNGREIQAVNTIPGNVILDNFIKR